MRVHGLCLMLIFDARLFGNEDLAQYRDMARRWMEGFAVGLRALTATFVRLRRRRCCVAFAVLAFVVDSLVSAQVYARELGVGGTPPAPPSDDACLSLGRGPLETDSLNSLVQSPGLVPFAFWLEVFFVVLQAAPRESDLAPDAAALPGNLRFAVSGGRHCD